VARDGGEVAEQQPSREGARELARALEPNLARAQSLLERKIAEPDSRERRQICRHDEIDSEAGILEAQVDLFAADDEPGGRRPAPPRHTAEVESHDGTPLGQLVDRETAPHIPQEQHRVEILRRGAARHPALAPGAELLDHAVELRARLGQTVFATPSRGPALDHAHILEVTQALRQQSPRDQRHSPPDLREPSATREELAKDQRRPPLREHLARDRHRTELAVPVHSGRL